MAIRGFCCLKEFVLFFLLLLISELSVFASRIWSSVATGSRVGVIGVRSTDIGSYLKNASLPSGLVILIGAFCSVLYSSLLITLGFQSKHEQHFL